MTRSTSITIDAPADLPEGYFVNLKITVSDSDSGTPSTPTGTVTVEASPRRYGANLIGTFTATLVDGVAEVLIGSEPLDVVLGNEDTFHIYVTYSGSNIHTDEEAIVEIDQRWFYHNVPATATVAKYPLRVFIIIPSDAVTATNQPWYDPIYDDLIYRAVDKTIGLSRQWIEEQTGYTFEYSVILHHSELTLQEFQTDESDVWVSEDDDCLEGMYGGALWGYVANTMGVTSYEQGAGPGEFRQFRHAAVLIGGGGHAAGIAGHNQHPTTLKWEDYGEALYGDWELREIILNASSSCSVPGGFSFRFPDDIELGVMSSFSHETLHMWNIECHVQFEVARAGDTLTSIAARNTGTTASGILSHNAPDLDAYGLTGVLPTGTEIEMPIALFYGGPWKSHQVTQFIENNQDRFITPVPAI